MTEHRTRRYDTDKKTGVLGDTSVTVPLYQTQISRGLTSDQTEASAVRGRRLAALAIGRFLKTQMDLSYS
jgi:hypothetical protein